MKPGWKTTEFWLTLITVLVGVAGPLIINYGLLTEEEVGLWGQAIIQIAGAVAAGFAVTAYNMGRARVKTGN
jgi:hypothetical protein